MAIKRKAISAILESESSDDEKISKFLDLMHSELDPLYDKVDKLEKEAESVRNDESATVKEWREKYEQEVEAHKQTKNTITEKETRGKKESALKELLGKSLSEQGIEKALKYANYDFEIDDNGKIKEASNLLKSTVEEWSMFAIDSETKGAEKQEKGTFPTSNKTFESMSLAEKMAYANEHPGDASVTEFMK